MFDIVKSCLYLFSILFLTLSIFWVKKNDRKLNAVSYFLISVWTVMCYQLSVAVLVDTLHIGVSIVSVGIMNYALALGCTFYTIYKRERQKYEIHIFDILVLLVLAGIAVFWGGSQFGWKFDCFNYQSSVDCSRHLMFAREVAVKHELTFNMPFMAVNTGLFFEAMYAFIVPYKDIHLILMTDVIMLFFAGAMFWTLVRYKLNTKLLLVMGGAASVFYMMVYPLNNMVFGTSYLGAGMTLSVVIFSLISRYESGEIKKYYFGITLVVALYSLLKTYNLFFPIVLISVIVYFGVKNIPRRFEKTLKFVPYILTGLFLACQIAICIIFRFFYTKIPPLSVLGEWGYMYCSLFGDFVFLFPFILYRIVNCYKTKKWSFDFIMGMFMIAYIGAFLYACYLGKVSPYYYYKNYYLFWAIAFYMMIEVVCSCSKERLEFIVTYCIGIFGLWLFVFTGIEAAFEEKSEINGQTLNYELNGRSLFRLYSWNFERAKEEAIPIPMNDDLESFYYKVADITLAEGEQIKCLNSIYYGYYEYFALGYQWEDPDKSLSTQDALNQAVDQYKYACVIYYNCYDLMPETAEQLKNYEVVFENNAGCIYRLN